MLLLLLAACDYEPVLVNLTGQISTSRFDASEGVSEASIASYDLVGIPVDEDVTDGRGYFEVQAVAGSGLFLELSAQDYATTTFSGSAPTSDMQFTEGSLWMITAAEDDAYRSRFAGCPGAADAPMVVGEVRIGLAGYTPEEGEWPLATLGLAQVTDVNGDVWPACYMGEDGLVYDPQATRTGVAGLFAVFGAAPGVAVLEVGYEIEDGVLGDSGAAYILVPEAGVVPALPFLLDLAQ